MQTYQTIEVLKVHIMLGVLSLTMVQGREVKVFINDTDVRPDASLKESTLGFGIDRQLSLSKS